MQGIDLPRSTFTAIICTIIFAIQLLGLSHIVLLDKSTIAQIPATPARHQTYSCFHPNFTHDIIKNFGKSTKQTSVWNLKASQPAKEYLPHNDRFFAKTRMFVGDESREKQFISKLHNKQCTKILICGGSNSGGTGATSGKLFWQVLDEWINKNFPCTTKERKRKHLISPKCVKKGAGVEYVVSNLNRFLPPNSDWDLIIAEQSMNTFLRPSSHPKNRVFTEIFLRRVLSLPNYPWLIFLSLSLSQKEFRDKMIMQQDETFDRWVLTGQYEQLKYTSFYDVTHLSWTNAVLSKLMSNGLERNGTAWERFPWSLVKSEIKGRIHINDFGHTSVALTLAHYLEMSSCYPWNSNFVQSRASLQEKLPRPLAKSTVITEMDTNFRNALSNTSLHTRMTNLYFEDGDISRDVRKRFWSFVTECRPDGSWQIVSETKQKKVGFLSTTVGSYFTLNVTCIDQIYVNYLESYEHMGAALVWLDYSSKVGSKDCGSTRAEDTVSMVKLDGLQVNSTVSVDAVHRFGCRGVGTNVFLHVCVVQSSPARAENKWKLLGVTN